MAKILTGIQSTGTPHLGNLLGAILPAIQMAKNPDNESFLFIADLHSITQIKNGAEYCITQMFFDNKKYFDFVAKCRAAGITVPIIPGLKPIATKKQLNLIPHRFSVDLPDDLIMEVVKAKDNEAVKQIGIEWCIEQSKELVKAGIPVLHYYSMGKAENIKQIAKVIF